MQSRLRREEGASLAFVLVVVSVFAIIAGGLLTEAGASMKYTTSVNNYEDKVYAADGGVALGIQQLQQHNNICPTTGSNQTLETAQVNGLTARVSCQVTAGSTEGGLGYAIITRAPGTQSLYVQGSAGHPKKINGPVYVKGDLEGFPNPGVSLTNGDFHHGACTGEPGGLVLEDGYRYVCDPTIPSYPPVTAPTLPSDALVLTAAQNNDSSCKYFYPGKYTSASLPTLDTSRTNYFASGVYYFELSSPWVILGNNDSNMAKVFGGQPATYEGNPQYTMPPCASDSSAITKAGGNVAEVSGTGVQFIFGSAGAMRVDNFTQVELFARTTDGTAATRTASFVTVPSTWSGGWVASSLSQATDFALNLSSGSNKQMVIHGQVYTPDQNVRLWATEGVEAGVLGGVIAWKLELQSSGDSAINVSAIDGSPDPRHVVVTATAPATPDPSQGQQVISIAVVEIANNDSRTVTVRSWRTRRATDAL